MTKKKNRIFGLKSNGIIIAESGRYGTTDIADKPVKVLDAIPVNTTNYVKPAKVETGVDMAVKIGWYKRFFQTIWRGIKWFFS